LPFGFGLLDIKKMKAKRDVEGLINALTCCKDLNKRINAAVALGDLGDPRAIDALSFSTAVTSEIGLVAVHSLEKIGGERSLDGLIHSLESPFKEVRTTAAQTLGRTDGVRALSVLLASCNDPEIFDQIAVVIENMREETKTQARRLLPALYETYDKLYNNPGQRMLAKAILNLGQDYSDQKYLEILFRWGEFDDRLQALDLAGHTAVKILETMSRHNDKYYRINAIYLFARFKNSAKSQSKVAEALFDSDEEVREFALKESFDMGLIDKETLQELHPGGLEVWDIPKVLKQISKYRISPEIIDIVLKSTFREHHDLEEWKEGLMALVTESGLTSTLVDWIIGAITIDTYDDGLINEVSLKRSDAAVAALCGLKSQIASNILQLIAQKKDTSVSFQPDTEGGESIKVIVSFQDQRNLALEELRRRGNPPYDISAYLSKDLFL
jgi:hypothetical protein